MSVARLRLVRNCFDLAQEGIDKVPAYTRLPLRSYRKQRSQVGCIAGALRVAATDPTLQQLRLFQHGTVSTAARPRALVAAGLDRKSPLRYMLLSSMTVQRSLLATAFSTPTL